MRTSPRTRVRPCNRDRRFNARRVARPRHPPSTAPGAPAPPSRPRWPRRPCRRPPRSRPPNCRRTGAPDAPASAPDEVKNAIYAANELTRKPYRYGGGHGSFRLDTAYDCSGSVSYALHGAGLLEKPMDSSALMRWGLRGKGAWITVYTNPRHAFAMIGGLRFDTSGPGQRGPRWRMGTRVSRGFVARHPTVSEAARADGSR